MVAVPGLIAALKGKQDKGLQELRVKLQRIVTSSLPSPQSGTKTVFLEWLLSGSYKEGLCAES